MSPFVALPVPVPFGLKRLNRCNPTACSGSSGILYPNQSALCAGKLVLFLRCLARQASEMEAIEKLQVWIAENVRKKLSVEMLADRVARM